MRRVFIIQEQTRWDTKLKKAVPRVDTSLAEDFGEIIVLIGPDTKSHHRQKVLDNLHSKLKNFHDEDYLVLTGNPLFIGLAVAVAADYNEGRVNFVQWSKSEQAYMPVKVTDIFVEEGEEEQNVG